MVDEYLRHSLVRSKNTEQKTFQAALRVFVQLEQTPLHRAEDQGDEGSDRATYTATLERYARVCKKIEEARKHMFMEQKR